MDGADRVEKLTAGFLSLSEEGKRYAAAVVDALAYAAELAKEPNPPEKEQPKESA